MIAGPFLRAVGQDANPAEGDDGRREDHVRDRENVEKCAGPGLIGGDIARGEIVELVDEAVEGE